MGLGAYLVRLVVLCFLILGAACVGGNDAEVTPPTELPSVSGGPDEPVQELPNTKAISAEVKYSDQKLEVTFSESLDLNSLNDDNFQLACHEAIPLKVMERDQSTRSLVLQAEKIISQMENCEFKISSQNLDPLQKEIKIISKHFMTPCSQSLPFYEDFLSPLSFFGKSTCWEKQDINDTEIQYQIQNGTIQFILSENLDTYKSNPAFFSPIMSSKDSMTFQFKISDFQEFIYDDRNYDQSSFRLGVLNSENASVSCGITVSDRNTIYPFMEIDNGEGNQRFLTGPLLGTAKSLDDLGNGGDLYFYIRIIDNTYQCSFKQGEQNSYQLISPEAYPYKLGDSLSLGLFLGHSPLGQSSITLDFIKAY